MNPLLDLATCSPVCTVSKDSYFQQIVDKINEYGGDVQKYAGDAIFAEWRVSSIITLEECVAAAAACSVSIVKDCANFSVMSLTGKFDTVSSAPSLNVHCGLGVGRLAGLHIGDNTHRREYLYLGDPITQATVACAHAELGEVVASPQFQKILTSLGLDGAAINEHRHEAKFVLANRDTVYVNVEKQESLITSRNAKPRGITDHVDGLHVDALIEYRRLMSLYAHPVVVSNDVAASNNFKLSTRSGTNQQHNREDAELRSVYIMFINPLVDLHLSGDAERDWKYVVLVNNIMNLVTRELNHHAGHLRQCIVDDKGLVLIATFGLRGSTFPNMVTERALPATFAVSRALEIELGVKSKIGATFGDVYCGAVGGELRHEYAVLGVSCNLAARLMCSPANPGILVDDAVRQIADQAYCFNALDPVKAKGYSQPVPIFEPRAPLVHAWGKIEGNFVGRRDEILKLTTIASEMMHTEFAAPKIAIILSPSGMGKSTLLAHLVEHVRRVLRAKRGKGPVIAKHACRECDLQVPFSTIRSLLPSMLASFEAPVDDPTNRSGCSSSYSDVFSLGYNSISAFSVFEDATATGSGSHMHATFEKICKELQLPESIFEFLKFHLLGIEVNHFFGGNTKVPSMRSIAVFVSQIFVTCCRDSSLVLVAVDDIHRTDEMSWLVLQQVFETAVNVLIVGSAHSAADLSLRIDRNFWTLLNESSARKGRFVRMAIERLSEGDIVSMIMKTFGLQSKDVEGSDILKEVLVQSGGSPHFAQKILDGIRQRCVSSQPDGSETDNAITEIVLHRVDSFDFAVRSILNVGAVLGLSFTLGGVLSVLEETNDAKDADLRRQTIVSLQFLVNEGILYLGQRGARSGLKQANIVDDCSTTFSFCQNVWRSTVLRLMLGSRKRDVHKMIAISMECAADENALSVDYMKKLFVHWHGAGDARKMASVALSINKLHMNDTEHLPESIRLYEETLKVWGFTPTCEQCSDGFAWKIMSVMSPSDLSKIISVLVAQGRALALCGRQKESITAYGNVLRIRGGAKAYSSIEDRSVTFPAFVGICDAVADGHVDQDVYRRYEQKLIFQFLDETSTQGCLVHQIHALYLQMNVFMQLGDFDKAMAAYLIITQTYNPDMHSTGLRNLYGKDSGALSFALSSYLLMTRGDSPQALKTCRYVLKEIYPKIETDLAQSFAMIYPLVLVMKDGGYNDGAWILFEKTVVKPFDENRQGQSILSSVYRPLAMMLAIAGKAEVNEGTLLEYSKWACDAGNLCFGARINLHLGRLGRCADSIGAEICTSLAMKLRKGPCRNSLVAQGKCLVEKSSDFLRKHRLNSAMEQLYQVRSQLENVAGYNPHDEFHNQDLIHSMDDVGTFIKEQLQI